MALCIGKIDYLNICHVFHLLEDVCPQGAEFQYFPGHPNQLNLALAQGELDISPSSSFEYLLRAEQYQLLPAASISAKNEVQSVLFLSPAPLEDLPAWLRSHPGPVCLTGASATSTALLKVLWSQKWHLPQVTWQEVAPGTGLSTGRPFLEIGNLALHHFVFPPEGYHIYDLATQWAEWTDLPFVFAVWITRRAQDPARQALLGRLQREIERITACLDQHYDLLSGLPQRPEWLTPLMLFSYWKSMHYDLGPREQAAMLLFAERCTCQGLLSGAPGLRWLSS